MKLTFTTIAALLLSTAAMADEPDFSEYNNGLTKSVCPANPHAGGGLYATGISVSHMGRFVRAEHAGAVAERTAFDVFVMPDHVDLRNTGQIAAYFVENGFTNFDFPTKSTRSRVTETGVEGIPRGEFDGSEQDWNHTAMDGSNTIRLRLADDRPVELRIGNTVGATAQGVGEGYIDLPAGQSFGGLKLHDATTGEALRGGTVSTNGSIAALLREVERTFTVRGNERWSC